MFCLRVWNVFVNMLARFSIISLLLTSMNVYADPVSLPTWTTVEKKFLSDSGRQAAYKHELIPVIETRNQYELGKLTALRFLEWVKDNPNGVISLTSGNTPEYFIKYLSYYKRKWQDPKVRAELSAYGDFPESFPDTSNLRFVQIEDYYPLSAKHYKKVSNYIQRHYCSILDIKPENTLLMNYAEKGILAEKGMHVLFMNGKVDLDVLDSEPSSQLEAWQQQAIRELDKFCVEYENKVRAWGGIDFFVGSISYGGHVGFNAPGTSVDSPTHITELDYRRGAQAAKDLGGIVHAQDKVAISIGLGTITMKPDVIMIVMADGDSKSEVVKDAVEREFDLQYPATIMQKIPNARFYVTHGAAKSLIDRRTEDISIATRNGWSVDLLEEVILQIALAEQKQILHITEADLEKYDAGKLILLNPPKSLPAILDDIRARLISKIDAGFDLVASKGKRLLHTAPHHDDIMLAYYPLVEHFSTRHKNHIAYLTSGFNSVSDKHVLRVLNRVGESWINQEQDEIFKRTYESTISKFKTLFAKQDLDQMKNLQTTILLKHLAYIYDAKNVEQLKHTVRWLKDEYFPNKHPGDLDIPSIKLLKGMIRESESDSLWSLKNIPLHSISHFRSEFYSGREFAKTPRFNIDVLPFINLLNDFRPEIITLADDPQSAPPKTNYYVLQIIADALRSKEVQHVDNLQIIGYRNIWFRYPLYESNIYYPVSTNNISMLRKVFASCFKTQQEAAFPNPFFAGEFSELAGVIQQDQLQQLKVLLGNDFFDKHSNPEIKNAVGMICMRRMNLNDLFKRAADLHVALELEDNFFS